MKSRILVAVVGVPILAYVVLWAPSLVMAAALCLQAFVKSDQLSRGAEAQDRAVALCQSAAEVIRANGGDLPAAAAALGLTYGAYAGESLDFEAHYHGDWTLSNTREYD